MPFFSNGEKQVLQESTVIHSSYILLVQKAIFEIATIQENAQKAAIVLDPCQRRDHKSLRTAQLVNIRLKLGKVLNPLGAQVNVKS